MTPEQVKPLFEARAEAMAAVDIIEWFGGEGLCIYGRVVPSRIRLPIWQTVLRNLVGPVAAAFTRCNFPLNPKSSGSVQNEWRMPRSAANWEPGTPKSAPLIARPVFMRP